jgi:NAD(P)H-hydrate repair Nnr-like enzyme with NAD(P)H-hydrate dehydratase domain
MGDALAGMIAAFIAQGLGAEQATLLGVHLHGAAADALVSQGLGPVGLTASEVVMEARHLLNHWLEWSKH